MVPLSGISIIYVLSSRQTTNSLWEGTIWSRNGAQLYVSRTWRKSKRPRLPFSKVSTELSWSSEPFVWSLLFPRRWSQSKRKDKYRLLPFHHYWPLFGVWVDNFKNSFCCWKVQASWSSTLWNFHHVKVGEGLEILLFSSLLPSSPHHGHSRLLLGQL